MPTLRDVARLAGVSTATVSHVVNNSRPVTPKTRALVEHAIAQTGYIPNLTARLLASRKSAEGIMADAPEVVNGSESGSNGDDENKYEPAGFGAAARPPLRGVVVARGAFGSSNSALRVLLIVRAAQPISRADLARRMEVNRSTVTEIVSPLLTAGVLREEEPVQDPAGRSGRPPVGLSFREGRQFLIGVSVGVHTTQVGAATLGGRILNEVTFDTPSDPTSALALISSAIGRFREAAATASDLGCVGVTVPGPTDADRALLLCAPHLGWRDVAVADALSCNAGVEGPKGGAHGVDVIVENDATAAALYESRRRLRDNPGDAWNDFALVRVGTGIGVGLVQGGKVFRGVGVRGSLAGEFGHMTIVAGGKLCVCGNRGCWERYAAEASAIALYTGDRPRAADSGSTHFLGIIARADAGERRARATLECVGEYLGIGISNVITGLGVTRVVVTGRIVEGWRFITDPLHEAVARTMAGRLGGWSVEPSQPAGAGLGGALEVAVEQYLTTLVTQKRAAA